MTAISPPTMTETQPQCPQCQGTGELRMYFRVRNNRGITSDSVAEPCPLCNGTGRLDGPAQSAHLVDRIKDAISCIPAGNADATLGNLLSQEILHKIAQVAAAARHDDDKAAAKRRGSEASGLSNACEQDEGA